MIHILQQEPFETLISFIISANNHIPRIRSIIERLCRLYGTPVTTPLGEAYTFPSPEALAEARLVDLRAKCGLGYRDAYVRSAARAVAHQSDFACWHELPTPTLRKRLLQLDGVGEKVADCVLLFGFHRLQAFPVDTWIHRAMTELYFTGREPRLREVQAMAATCFGDYAGVAQQYLFAGFRSKKVSLQ
jgi:N-glycosylase/DNA lyase